MAESHEGSPVEVWAFIEKDECGYPKSQDWEDLGAWPIDDRTVRIQSIPFFAKNIASGDIANVTQAKKGFMAVDRIVQHCGHSIFRIFLNEKSLSNRDKVVCELKQRGADVEVTLDRLLAVDAPPEHEPVIWEYLEQGRDSKSWDLQVGYSPV